MNPNMLEDYLNSPNRLVRSSSVLDPLGSLLDTRVEELVQTECDALRSLPSCVLVDAAGVTLAHVLVRDIWNR